MRLRLLGDYSRDDGLVHWWLLVDDCLMAGLHGRHLGTGVCHDERQILGQDVAICCVLGQLLTLLQSDSTENFCRSFSFLKRANFASRSRTSRVLSLNTSLRTTRYYCSRRLNMFNRVSSRSTLVAIRLSRLQRACFPEALASLKW